MCAVHHHHRRRPTAIAGGERAPPVARRGVAGRGGQAGVSDQHPAAGAGAGRAGGGGMEDVKAKLRGLFQRKKTFRGTGHVLGTAPVCRALAVPCLAPAGGSAPMSWGPSLRLARPPAATLQLHRAWKVQPAYISRTSSAKPCQRPSTSCGHLQSTRCARFLRFCAVRNR